MSEYNSTEITAFNSTGVPLSQVEAGGAEKVIKFTYVTDATSGLVAGDFVKLSVDIPAGATLTGGEIQWDAMSTGAVFQLAIAESNADMVSGTVVLSGGKLLSIAVNSAGQDTFANLKEGDTNALKTISAVSAIRLRAAASAGKSKNIKGIVRYVPIS
jgi:hypothetical protein